MSGFIEGDDRSQATLFPERLDDYVAEDNAVRVIDIFIDDLDISGLSDSEVLRQEGFHRLIQLEPVLLFPETVPFVALDEPLEFLL